MGEPSRVEIEGDLGIEEQEGGYCEDEVTVAGDSIAGLFAGLLGLERCGRGSFDDAYEEYRKRHGPARVRVTVELIGGGEGHRE